MKGLVYFNNDDFLKFVDSKLKYKSKFHLYLQTWQDGDGFLDICAGDGGIKPEQSMIFNERNKHYVFSYKSDLLNFTEKLIAVKSFSSANEIFKLGFEIFINCNADYFVLCPELNKGYYAKLNVFNRFIGFFNHEEPWQNEKFSYWQRQK